MSIKTRREVSTAAMMRGGRVKPQRETSIMENVGHVKNKKLGSLLAQCSNRLFQLIDPLFVRSFDDVGMRVIGVYVCAVIRRII